MSKRIKLKKVCLSLGGKDVLLTIEQAKELKDLLNDTFGSERVIYRDWYRPYWNTWTTGNYYSSTGMSTSDATIGQTSCYNISTSDDTLTLAAA